MAKTKTVKDKKTKVSNCAEMLEAALDQIERLQLINQDLEAEVATLELECGGTY